MLICEFSPLYFCFKCVWDPNKGFLIFFFYLSYLCLPLPVNFISGYSFGSWDYNAVLLIRKLISFRFSGVGVNTVKDFTSVLLSSFSGYWYSFNSCLICINTCCFLVSFNYNYIATNLLSKL